MYEFLAFSTIKGNPCSISTVWGNSYLKKSNKRNTKKAVDKKKPKLLNTRTYF